MCCSPSKVWHFSLRLARKKKVEYCWMSLRSLRSAHSSLVKVCRSAFCGSLCDWLFQLNTNFHFDCFFTLFNHRLPDYYVPHTCAHRNIIGTTLEVNFYHYSITIEGLLQNLCCQVLTCYKMNREIFWYTHVLVLNSFNNKLVSWTCSDLEKSTTIIEYTVISLLLIIIIK